MAMHLHTPYGTRIRWSRAKRTRREAERGGAISPGNEQMRLSQVDFLRTAFESIKLMKHYTQSDPPFALPITTGRSSLYWSLDFLICLLVADSNAPHTAYVERQPNKALK